MIASTLMHEFGHNAERRHGGDPLDQNCKPTYLSVMNYLYQLRGLLDNAGTPHLDFSGGGGLTVNESPPTALPGQPYRLGVDAPLETSYLFGQVAQAKTFCNGAPYPTGTTPWFASTRRRPPARSTGMRTTAPGQLYPQQDVNFNGYLDNDNTGGALPPLTDSNDWAKLRLNQVAIRRNVGVHYRIPGTLEIAIGPSSTDLGKTEGGKTEGGKTEGGKTEGGKTEGGAGWSDLGKTEGGVVFGKTEGGSGDDGRGLFGGGDTFQNHPFNPSGEIDSDYDVNLPPPYEFKACVIGDCSFQGAPTTPRHGVWVSFKPVGGATSYTVYRASGTTLTAGQMWTQVVSLLAVSGLEKDRPSTPRRSSRASRTSTSRSACSPMASASPRTGSRSSARTTRWWPRTTRVDSTRRMLDVRRQPACWPTTATPTARRVDGCAPHGADPWHGF